MALHDSSVTWRLSAVVLCDNSVFVPILLRHWRERRGYSVRELAARAGVGYVTVHRIEVGRISPTVSMLEKLATALEINVREFFPVEPRPSKRRGRR